MKVRLFLRSFLKSCRHRERREAISRNYAIALLHFVTLAMTGGTYIRYTRLDCREALIRIKAIHRNSDHTHIVYLLIPLAPVFEESIDGFFLFRHRLFVVVEQ